MIISKNKKAISEIVSYTLLIVIAMALAAGVYSYLKFYVPPEKEVCSEDIMLTITGYQCDSAGKVIALTVNNRGYFNIDGFFAKVANESNKIPTIMIAPKDPTLKEAMIPGRFDFEFSSGSITSSTLKNKESKKIEFDYAPMDSIKRLQIQPYVKANKTKDILICRSVTIPIENCN